MPKIEDHPVPGYSKDGKSSASGKEGPAPGPTSESDYGLFTWQRLLQGTTLTLGCNNVFGQDPPDAFGQGGNAVGYPGFTYDATGRFVYVRLTKKF